MITGMQQQSGQTWGHGLGFMIGTCKSIARPCSVCRPGAHKNLPQRSSTASDLLVPYSKAAQQYALYFNLIYSHQGCQAGLFDGPKKYGPLLKVGLEIFENLLSSGPFLKSIKVFIVTSKIRRFLKQSLAFFSFHHLATWQSSQFSHPLYKSCGTVEAHWPKKKSGHGHDATGCHRHKMCLVSPASVPRVASCL